MKNRFLLLAVLGACLLSGTVVSTVVAQTCDICGDINDDGLNGIADETSLMSYFRDGFVLGSPDCASVDGHELVTIRDLSVLLGRRFDGQPPFICPDALPKLVPTVDSQFVLSYTSIVPAEEPSPFISIRLQNPVGVTSMSLTLHIEVDGQPAVFDSVSTIYPWGFGGLLHDFRPNGNVLLFGANMFLSNAMAPGSNELGRIYLNLPPAPNPRTVTAEWITLAILAPPFDSSLYPMVIEAKGGSANEALPAYEPILVGAACCERAGDANHDGVFNIADITFGIERIFSSGTAPVCQDEADANGDNTFNIADVTFGIARIFLAGPAPVCGTTGI